MGKAKYLISIVLVFLLLSGFFTKSADAKDERELAKELAKQFDFYELAEEILQKELARADFADKDEEIDYKYKCAEALRDVYKWHATYLEKSGENEKAHELRAKAKELINEWTQKRFGDDEKGRLHIAGQTLVEGENLVNRAPFEEDLDKRAEIIRNAEENYTRAKEVFQEIAEKYLAMLDDILWGIESENETERNEWYEKYNLLKLSWYQWAKSLYLLGKMGVDTKQNYKLALKHIDDISFEFSTDAIAYYALLLQGDILYEQEKYQKSQSMFESVLTLPRTYQGWNEEAQAEADGIRQEAYYKAAQCLMKLKKYEDAVKLMNQMIDVDYPQQTQDWYVKLARLLKVEAQIKMGMEPSEVIKEESFVSFSKDPEEYFRGKYYDVLASIGRYPELDLKTRILCARAAYDQAKFVDAVPIYQLALNQLTDDTEFERYAPEIYFRIGDSFQRKWRFAEAASALIEGSQKLVYLNFKYKDKKEVPVHMQENFGLKQKYLFMDNKNEYQIDMVLKIAVTLAEKAHQNAAWVPEASTNGTQAYEFAREIEKRKSNIEGIIGGSEKSLQINFQKEVYDKRFIPAWKDYKSNKMNSNFFSTIAGFNALTRIVGPKVYLNSLYLSADLMKIHYDLINDDQVKNVSPYPEKVDWENSETFVNGSRNYQGRKFYEWEKQRIGDDNLQGISDNMKVVMMDYLNNILDPEVANKSKLIYYQKVLYIYLKAIFETILIDKPAFEATYEGVFDKDLATLIDSYSKYVKNIYMKKLGMSVEGPEIKVATVFDEMSTDEIQTIMDDFSKALIEIGYIMYENPWSDDGFLNKDLKDAQELLSKDDNTYKENEIKLKEYEEKSNSIRKQINYFWTDYDNNFSIYFIDKNNEENHKQLQEKYLKRARNVLYFAFVIHTNFEYYFEAEKDYLSYSRVLADQIEKDKDLREKMLKMVNRLSVSFEVYNNKKFGKYVDAYANLGKIRAALLGSNFVTIEDIVKGLNYSALEDRKEQRGDEEITINDKEYLLNVLKNTDTGEYKLVENTPFQQFLPEITKQFVTWASKGEKEKINAYCKRFKFDLTYALREYYTKIKKVDVADENLMSEFMKELVDEIGLENVTTKTHSVITQIYNNYLTVVYLNRQHIADEIYDIMNIYLDKYASVGAKAAKYEYMYLKLDKGDKIKLNSLRRTGKKLYGVKQYPEAIDFLQNFMTQIENNPDLYIFKDGKPAPIADKDDLKYEIVVRSMLGKCYLEEAKKDGPYSPDNVNWQQADFNLTRLFDFIRYRFEQQLRGKTDRISWEKHLDEYYYENMNNYKEMLEMKAAYIQNNGGKFKLDTNIESFSLRMKSQDGKLVEVAEGEDIQEVDAEEAAFITLTRVLWICHYLANQSPEYSPSQRQFKYLEKYKTYIKIAHIGKAPKYREQLQAAKEDYKSILGDHDLETYVFFGDPDFSVEFKKLIREIESFK